MNPGPQLALVCPNLDSQGAVAEVAAHHARALAGRFSLTVLAAVIQAELPPGVSRCPVAAPSFHWLRRWGHAPREAAFAIAARRRLEKRHRAAPLHLILFHGHVPAALAGLPMKRRHGVPYGLVIHGDIFDRPAGTYDPMLTRLYRLTTPRACQNADCIIALSPAVREQALRSGARADRIVVIPNGLDPGEIGLEEGPPPAAPRAPGRLEVLYAGRLSLEKGVDVLIQACALLSARHIPFRLRIAGDGPRDASLREQVRRAGLAGRVEFLGRLPRRALGALYQSADVLCVPSRSEPFGLVALEGMAAGALIVASRTGGLMSIVEDGRTGLLVPPGNPAALAETLEEVFRQPGRNPVLCRRAWERLREHYTWPRCGERMAAALLECVGRHGAAPFPAPGTGTP